MPVKHRSIGLALIYISYDTTTEVCFSATPSYAHTRVIEHTYALTEAPRTKTFTKLVF